MPRGMSINNITEEYNNLYKEYNNLLKKYKLLKKETKVIKEKSLRPEKTVFRRYESNHDISTWNYGYISVVSVLFFVTYCAMIFYKV